MSINEPEHDRKPDRRVRRTRDRLGDALIELMLQKSFDTITVQDVLDRADVGRSTFYVHYRDKEDLFISDVDDFWSSMASMLSRNGDTSERVAPVRELLAHISSARAFVSALNEAGRTHDVFELGRLHFARAIEERLAANPRARGLAADRRAALSHAFAGALLSMMFWGLDSGNTSSPQAMDTLFHTMVWSTVDAAGFRP